METNTSTTNSFSLPGNSSLEKEYAESPETISPVTSGMRVIQSVLRKPSANEEMPLLQA